METYLYEDSPFVFVPVTLLMGGWAAWMTGKASASTWSRYPILFFYLVLLTMGVRFLHQAPFGGNSAAVCLLDAPADAGWMQAVAAELRQPATAFSPPPKPTSSRR